MWLYICLQGIHECITLSRDKSSTSDHEIRFRSIWMPLFRHDSCRILELTDYLNFLKVYKCASLKHLLRLKSDIHIKINIRLNFLLHWDMYNRYLFNFWHAAVCFPASKINPFAIELNTFACYIKLNVEWACNLNILYLKNWVYLQNKVRLKKL